MSTITKVVVAGATGNLGPSIVNQLVANGFQVTAFSHSGKRSGLPDSVKTVKVDYDSVDALAEALKGQDAVVSTIDAMASQNQLNLIEAATKAGVRRFIPSEFGANTLDEKTSQIPVFGGKVATQNVLKEKAAQGSLSYTFVITGIFLDWAIGIGFLINPKGKSIEIWDGGDVEYSSTTLDTIGQAVAGVLKHPEETANRPVYVQSRALTSNKLLAISKKVLGFDGWTETPISSADVLASAWAEVQKENPNPDKFVFPFIKASVFGKEYESRFAKLDNELLGIKEITDAELEAIIEKVAK